MSEVKRTLKQKAYHGVREYLLISLYLFVVFSLFLTYKRVILAENHIDFAPHGFALFNALALAKVMLTEILTTGTTDGHLEEQRFLVAGQVLPVLGKALPN